MKTTFSINLDSWHIGIGWNGTRLVRILGYNMIMFSFLCFTLMIKWNCKDMETVLRS